MAQARHHRGHEEGAGPRLRLLTGGELNEPSPTPERPDEDLLLAFQRGDDRAFEELVRRHQRTVRAVVRRYAERPEDVLDLAQKAFLRALTAARRPRWLRLGARAPFRAVLLRIAANLGRNHARDARRWSRAPLEAADDAAHAVAARGTAELERAEQRRRLRRAVVELPRRQREVLALRIDAELPFAEIARALAISENAAKVHFHHATRRLASLVAGREEVP
jgi:RNA polymerase sigma-70 factor (ECF subfamily)